MKDLRTRATVSLVLAALGAVSLLSAGAAQAKEVQPDAFSLGSFVASVEVESTNPVVRDSITLFGIGALGQHTIILDRLFNPNTMRGTVSGTIGATAADNHLGELHGVITPDGMSGTVIMTRFREDGATDKFVGRWSAEGHPGSPTPGPFPLYWIAFDGRYVVSPS